MVCPNRVFGFSREADHILEKSVWDLVKAEFAGRKMELGDYDLIFNCEKFKVDLIVKTVASVAQMQGLI